MPAPPRPAPGPSRPAEADALIAALTGRGLSAALAEGLVEDVLCHRLPFAAEGDLRALVAGELARRIPVRTPSGSGGRVLAFVGPGGAGKTRCVAALASAYASRSTLPVACVTLRSKDRGAELATLLGPVAVQVHAVEDVRAAAERVDALRGRALVLVDTPSTSPRSVAAVGALADELERLRVDEVHLAVPATIAPEVARELVTGSALLGVTGLALTHADETERVGTVVQLAVDTAVPLAYVGAGAGVEGGLAPADATALARTLAA